MAEQDSILQLKTEINTLKIKDEYRSKELDALIQKLDNTTSKLNSLSNRSLIISKCNKPKKPQRKP